MSQALTKKGLRYPDPEDRIFNHDISDISDVLRETSFTISDPSRQLKPKQRE